MIRSILTRGSALLLASSAVFATATATATAQEPPGMLATSEYLFVLRGGWLYQYDVHSLELRNTVRLGAGEPPAVGISARGVAVVSDAEPTEEPEEEPMELQEPEEPEEEIADAGGRAGGAFGGRATDRGARAGKRAAAAIELGLRWLAEHQDDDGKWDADGFMKHDARDASASGRGRSDGAGNPVHDVGMTGLAMLAMLGDGSTLRSGPHRESLTRAAQWLRSQQGDNGRFGTAASHDFIYDHAIATYAMSEAYGLSESAPLAPCVQRALDYLESHRNPYEVWRYQPRDGDNDTSVTSWCLLALRSGATFGLDVNKTALQSGLAWLDSVTTEDGRCGYTKAGERSSRMPGDHAARFPVDKTEALTAAGLFLRFFLGQEPKTTKVMVASADRLLASLPQWDDKAGTIDHYYWFYGTYAMYQMGGKYWQQWQSRMAPAVIDHQRREGPARGSWDPVGVWGESGGRVYSTSLMLLSLQAYDRYTRRIR